MLSNILDENNIVASTIKGINSLECTNNTFKTTIGEIYRGKNKLHVQINNTTYKPFTKHNIKLLISNYNNGVLKTNVNSNSQLEEYTNITNVSWMYKVSHKLIILAEEWGQKIHLVRENDIGKGDILHTINLQLGDTKKVDNPVYITEYNGYYYVTCYAYNAGCIKMQIKNNKFINITRIPYKPYGKDPENQRIHQIEVFNPIINNLMTSNHSRTFLLATDVSEHVNNQKLLILSEDDIFSEIFDFTSIPAYNGSLIKPRHFVQIPNTNYLAVLTESIEVFLILLEYNLDTNRFDYKDYIDFKGDFLHHAESIGVKGLTGAEIKYHNNHIYLTLRGYKNVFGLNAGNDITLSLGAGAPIVSTGFFIKCKVNIPDGLLDKEDMKYVAVEKEPRHFTILKNENVALVANQDSGSVTAIEIDTMKSNTLFKFDNFRPNFILEEENIILKSESDITFLAGSASLNKVVYNTTNNNINSTPVNGSNNIFWITSGKLDEIIVIELNAIKVLNSNLEVIATSSPDGYSSYSYATYFNNYIYVSEYYGPRRGVFKFKVEGSVVSKVGREVNRLSPENRVHQIEQFKPLNGEPFLIACEFITESLYKIIDNGDKLDSKVLIDLSNIRELKKDKNVWPRHFSQIPGTNKIVLLTESNEVYLILLEYDSASDTFKYIKHIDFIERIKDLELLPGLTGAEIMVHTTGNEPGPGPSPVSPSGDLYTTTNEFDIYITLRGYPSPFNENLRSSGGHFIKCKLNNTTDKLEVLDHVDVKEEPRHFIIVDNTAIVASQLVDWGPGQVALIDLGKEKLEAKFKSAQAGIKALYSNNKL